MYIVELGAWLLLIPTCAPPHACVLLLLQKVSKYQFVDEISHVHTNIILKQSSTVFTQREIAISQLTSHAIWWVTPTPTCNSSLFISPATTERKSPIVLHKVASPRNHCRSRSNQTQSSEHVPRTGHLGTYFQTRAGTARSLHRRPYYLYACAYYLCCAHARERRICVSGRVQSAIYWYNTRIEARLKCHHHYTQPILRKSDISIGPNLFHKSTAGHSVSLCKNLSLKNCATTFIA